MTDYMQQTHELAAQLSEALGMPVDYTNATDDLARSLSTLRDGICCFTTTTLRVPALGQYEPVLVSFSEARSDGGDRIGGSPSYVFVDALYQLAPNTITCALRAFIARVPKIKEAVDRTKDFDSSKGDCTTAAAIECNERTAERDIEKIIDACGRETIAVEPNSPLSMLRALVRGLV